MAGRGSTIPMTPPAGGAHSMRTRHEVNGQWTITTGTAGTAFILSPHYMFLSKVITTIVGSGPTIVGEQLPTCASYPVNVIGNNYMSTNNDLAPANGTYDIGTLLNNGEGYVRFHGLEFSIAQEDTALNLGMTVNYGRAPDSRSLLGAYNNQVLNAFNSGGVTDKVSLPMFGSKFVREGKTFYYRMGPSGLARDVYRIPGFSQTAGSTAFSLGVQPLAQLDDEAPSVGDLYFYASVAKGAPTQLLVKVRALYSTDYYPPTTHYQASQTPHIPADGILMANPTASAKQTATQVAHNLLLRRGETAGSVGVRD